ncbi:MAG: hydroxymethylbilane synthase, partial [Oligoflexales bacterium]|nr:hydroxymethylbilane synthase [Oligoflexales bacterium]
ESSLLDDEADIAVHSLKDCPVKMNSRFTLAAVLERDSPSDIIIFRPDVAKRFSFTSFSLSRRDVAQFSELKIATGSLRRSSLLKSVIPAIQIMPVRGNIDTRLSKLKSGEWDAVILAEAGINRLKYDGLSFMRLDPEWFIPSPSQGALVIETLKNSPLADTVSSLSCHNSTREVTMERKVMELLGGDCTMPVGCHVYYDKNRGESIGRAIVLDYYGSFAFAEKRTPERIMELSPAQFIDGLIEDLEKNGLNDILDRLLKKD